MNSREVHCLLFTARTAVSSVPQSHIRSPSAECVECTENSSVPGQPRTLTFQEDFKGDLRFRRVNGELLFRGRRLLQQVEQRTVGTVDGVWHGACTAGAGTPQSFPSKAAA